MPQHIIIILITASSNHLYSLHKRHIKHNAKKYQCVYTVHKITHLFKKKHTQNVTVKIIPRYLRESVYGMGAVLMYNFGKDNLKDLRVKATQKDFNAEQ